MKRMVLLTSETAKLIAACEHHLEEAQTAAANAARMMPRSEALRKLDLVSKAITLANRRIKDVMGWSTPEE